MLCTLSNLKGIVTAAKKAAAIQGIDQTALYSQAGVTAAQVDAVYAALGNIDHATLIRLLNVPRIAMSLEQFNGYDASSIAKSPGNKDGDITVTHNAAISSVLGDLSA